MTLTRYHIDDYETFGKSMGPAGFDVRFKKINYTETGSTEIKLSRNLFYPMSPGCLSIAGESEYWVDDKINVGVRYYVTNPQPYASKGDPDFFPLCELFYYIENKL